MSRMPAATVAAYQRAEESFAWWLTHYVRTLDPKNPDSSKRVRLVESYPFIYETALTLQTGVHLHILKSRQMMATTLVCAFFLWNLLYRDGWSGLLLSRKDTLVDDGGEHASWNSLFGRVLFMYRSLPEWQQHQLEIRGGRISCPYRNSYIVGESGNVRDAGRGGVYSSVLMDEAAKIPRSETVFSAINDAAAQIIMNSTPAGKQGVFYRIYRSAQSRFTKIKLHWKIHPLRDQTWYEEQCRDRTEEDIAEELDCSFVKSVRGRCIPEFDWDRNVSYDARYEPQLELSGGWDFGFGDPTAVVLRQRKRNVHTIPASLQRQHLIIEDFAPLAEALVRRMGYVGSLSDIYCVGDSEGNRVNRQTRKSDIRAYRDFGWIIHPVTCQEKERHRRIRNLCKSGELIVHPDNGELIECMQQLRYALDADGNVLSMEHSDRDPEHHRLYSNLPDALGYDLYKHVRIGGAVEPALLAGV